MSFTFIRREMITSSIVAHSQQNSGTFIFDSAAQSHQKHGPNHWNLHG